MRQAEVLKRPIYLTLVGEIDHKNNIFERKPTIVIPGANTHFNV